MASRTSEFDQSHIWIAAFAALLVLASQDSRSSERVSFERYNVEDGMASPTIISLHQHSSGYLLVSTRSGLQLFDGLTFSKPILRIDNGYESNLVARSVHVSNSSILIGGAHGLYIYNPSTDQGIARREKALGIDSPVLAIGKQGVDYLIGTSNGLYKVDKDLTRSLLISGSESRGISTIRKAENLTWIGTDSGLYTLRDQTFTLTESTKNIAVTDILSTSRGLWIASKNDGLTLLDPKNDYKPSFTGFADSNISGLIEDESKNLWVGSDKGLMILTGDNKLRQITRNETDNRSISNDTIHALLRDEGGNVWVGTQNGLNKHIKVQSSFPLFDQHSTKLNGDTIIKLNELSNGDLTVSTTKGLNIKKTEEAYFQSVDVKGLASNHRIMTINESGKHLLLGTMRHGVAMYRTKDLSLVQHYHKDAINVASRIPSNGITKVLSLNDESNIISTFGKGIFFLEKGGNVRVPGEESALSELKDKHIMDMHQDSDGNLWFLEFVSSIYKYDFETNELIEHKLLGPGWLEYNFTEFRVDGSNIWVASNQLGLFHVNTINWQTKRITTAQGLASNTVYAIEIDHSGNIWLSTTHGISRLNPDTEEITSFGKSHGLQANDFNEGASLKLSDGTLLFGGNNGFNAIDPSNIKLNTYKGNTLVTSFSKMNERQPGRFLSDGSETIHLNYDENVFSFGYALMDFASPEDNTYEYQLVGFDADWIDAGKRSTATYTNLDAGNYTFQVRGRNNDGLLTDKIGTVHLQISPPPWLTWWAYTLYWIFAALLIFFGLRLYARNVARRIHEKRNEEEKQRLELLVAERTQELSDKTKELLRTLHQKELANKEIHHRVKNNLQVILGLLTLQAESEESELFRDAMDQVRQRITSMSLIHKSLYENNVASIDFKQYTENLVASIRQFHPDLASGNIEVLLDVESEVLDIDTALPVGLILNELITNAIKHGFDLGDDSLKVIKIVFKRSGGSYRLEVSDNGHGLPEGFDINSATSMGSELSLIFSQQLQGTLTAATAAQGGASFLLTFPATEKQIPEEEVEQA